MVMANTTKKNKLWIFLVMGILALALLVTLWFIPDKQETVKSQENKDYHEKIVDQKRYTYDSSIVSILFMGIDTKDSEKLGQADMLDLVLLNRDQETMQVVSISRDTMTKIHLFDVEHHSLGWDTQHLALAYTYGDSHQNGATLTRQAVSKLLLDVPIVHFAAMDLGKLPLVQEIVGQLEVVVPNDSLVDMEPAWQTGNKIILTKDNVETFVRTRDIEQDYSNQDRMERQKAYLNAYMEKMKQMLSENFEKTVGVLYNVCKQMTTNITIENVEAFANMLLTYTYDEKADFMTLPGTNQTTEVHDEFIVDQPALEKFVLDLFYKEEN